MVVIVRVAAIFPGRQSGRWGVHDTRSHWRGRGRERGDGGWSRERGNSFVMALKKGYEEEEGSEREGSVRGTGCARGRERAGGRVLFVRYTEKQRPRAKDAREEKRKSRLDHNLIFREDTKAKHDGGQRTTATTLRDCGTDSPRTWSTRPNRLGALAIYGSNSFITRHVSLSQRALLAFCLRLSCHNHGYTRLSGLGYTLLTRSAQSLREGVQGYAPSCALCRRY